MPSRCDAPISVACCASMEPSAAGIVPATARASTSTAPCSRDPQAARWNAGRFDLLRGCDTDAVPMASELGGAGVASRLVLCGTGRSKRDGPPDRGDRNSPCFPMVWRPACRVVSTYTCQRPLANAGGGSPTGERVSRQPRQRAALFVAPTSSAASLRRSGFRAVRTTSAPSARARRAVSSPMPALPPITTTVCPSSSGSRWLTRAARRRA
jgi:hypothetical protein